MMILMLMIVILLLFINYALGMCSKFNFKKININLDNIETYKFLDGEAGTKLEGYDTRNNLIDNDEEIFKINKYLEMKQILKTLENDKVGILDKLTIIKNYDLLEYNIGNSLLEGGLLDDWNFNITL
jgi:hypothetical protein